MSETLNARSPAGAMKRRRRDLMIAAGCGTFVVFMVAMAYAAVPLYSLFCRTTGFGGTTKVARAAPSQVLTRTIRVRLDTNVAAGLPWKFEPEQEFIDVKLGEVATVLFRVINQTARQTLGQAAYNVAPATAGAYFAKINCFCFSEQRLSPGEQREMPVVFFVDPALAKDSEQTGLNTITLSYTMYPVREREALANRELTAAEQARAGEAAAAQSRR